MSFVGILYDLFNRTNLFFIIQALGLEMAKNLSKRIAILEMYKAKHSPKDIAQSLIKSEQNVILKDH